jgi:hypothetical protein
MEPMEPNVTDKTLVERWQKPKVSSFKVKNKNNFFSLVGVDVFAIVAIGNQISLT